MTDKAFKPLSYSEEKHPCRGCTERTDICHCVCEKYKEHEQLKAEKRAAIQREKDKERVQTSYFLENYRKRRWYK